MWKTSPHFVWKTEPQEMPQWISGKPVENFVENYIATIGHAENVENFSTFCVDKLEEYCSGTVIYKA